MAIHSGDQGSEKIDNSEKLLMNVLSIDIDWIMEPSIQAYNDFIYTNNGLSLDDILLRHMPGISVEADFSKYLKIVRLLLKNIKEAQQTGWAQRHDDIVYFLDLKDNQKINLFNVDHHHDINYSDIRPDNKYFKLNCGNWIDYLASKNQINMYTWISNKTSIPPDDQLLQALPNYIECKDIDMLDNMTFDKIFVSCSPEWIPKKYHPLSDAITSIIDFN